MTGIFFKPIIMKKIIFIVLTTISIASCKKKKKKILIYASGDVKTDESKKNITVGEGTTHHEDEIEFSGSEPIVLNAQTPSGKFTLEANEDGLYIANLKNDTVVGSYQRVGATSNSKISQPINLFFI